MIIFILIAQYSWTKILFEFVVSIIEFFLIYKILDVKM